MEIKLECIALTNFRGVRTLRVDFSGPATTIYGDNQTGKTTIYNAFLWLLFGKDNLDRKDFEIKTLGPDNEPYHRLDHEVSANLTIDGSHTALKRTYREKWVKKKGNTETEFTGHETLLFWNEVPLKLEDYQAKVNGILKENVFKMITSTGYFNSMKWQDRRAILQELAGSLDDAALLPSISTKQGGKFDGLINALNGNKTIEEFKREISNKKKKIKDELEHIPARIEEADRSLPDPKDYVALTKQMAALNAELTAIDNQLMDKSQAQRQRQNEISEKIKMIGDLKVALNGIEFHIKNEVRERAQARQQLILDEQRHLQSMNDAYTRFNSDLATEEGRVKMFNAEKEELTAKWHKINNEVLTFDEGKFSCPTCKRAYEASGIEEKKAEMTRNFNQDKSKRLAEITADGKKLAGTIDVIKNKMYYIVQEAAELKGSIAEKQNSISILTDQHATLATNENASVQNDIRSNSQHQSKLAEIAQLEAEVNAPEQGDDSKNDLLQKKRDLSSKVTDLTGEMADKGQRERILDRINELKASESKMAGELADLERTEFAIYEYTRAKMDEIESRINDRFSLVKFKMFREQVNGGQEECCETLINGVPFGVANTASQINAGLDIINVMSSHFDIHAPVFVDNRESVVNLIPSRSQIINLIVVRGAMLSVGKVKYRKDYKHEAELQEA